MEGAVERGGAREAGLAGDADKVVKVREWPRHFSGKFGLYNSEIRSK
jgi:hypothetical protein